MVTPATLLVRRARTQHSLITDKQAVALGVPTSTLANWVRAGRLERPWPRVYRIAGAPVTWEQKAMAAVLCTSSVASHRTAARIWRLGDYDDIEVTVPRTRRGTANDDALVHRSTDLARRHVTTRHGIPVTNPMRTLVDLGAVDREAVADALERALIERVCGIVGIERVLDDVARRGRDGAGVIRAVLDERALGRAVPEGLLEARMARLLREHGLPAPRFQYRLGRFRVDFAYPAVKLAIEVDGFEVHGTPSALQRDLHRQNALVAKGWTVLRFTWLDVVRRPAEVAAEIAGVLSRAA
jgi:very-short-patch-repair endonuclease